MFSRFTVSAMLAAAILVSANNSLSANCGLLNGQSQKACACPCCAKKPCCATSNQRNEIIPPLTTAPSFQQHLSVAAPASSVLPFVPPVATDASSFPTADVCWHSTKTFSLIC